MDFDGFFAEHYDRTRRAMTLACGSGDLAEELTQEASYRALRRWRRVSRLDRPDAWVLVVALNLGRDSHRRTVHHEATAPAAAATDPAQDTEAALIATGGLPPGHYQNRSGHPHQQPVRRVVSGAAECITLPACPTT